MAGRRIERARIGHNEGMPNQPKTPITAVRIPSELKAAAKAKAEREGETLTAVIVRSLEEYVTAH